jgi:hypothetical protein
VLSQQSTRQIQHTQELASHDTEEPVRGTLSASLLTNSPKHSRSSQSEISFVGTHTTSKQPNLLSMDEFDEETWAFVIDLANRIVRQCVASSGRCAFRTYCLSQHESSTFSQSNTRQTLATSLSTSLKRPVRDDDDINDASDDGDQERLPECKRQRENRDNSMRLFTCPYAKFDPERCSERNDVEKNYRNCSSKYLNSIARAKQHLYRIHMQPASYCCNCYKKFQSRGNLNEHIRERICERQPPRYEEQRGQESSPGSPTPTPTLR